MGFSNDRIINAKKMSGVVSNRNYADALAGFENGLNNLIGYSDGTTRPTGVFGGSATNLTKSSNSTNPLENAISLKIARTAAAQGQGYYFDFVPSRNDKLSAATLNIKFFHELLSGTFSGSVNPSVDSDLIIGVWDMANNKNIEPKNRLIEPMVSNYVYRYSSNFQIPINATTLRVYIHCATTNSVAFELNLDALEISTINVVNATIRPPVGSIIAHSSTTPPDGYLYCNGQTVSRTQYAKLFSVVGTKYGQGDGSTTFHVPDLRGRFLRGVNNGSGVDPDAASRTAMNTGGATGDNVGSVQADAGQTHGHTISDPGHFHTTTVNYNAEGTGGNAFVLEDASPAVIGPVQANTNSVATGISIIGPNSGNFSTETRPENANVAYMICYDDGNVQFGNVFDSSVIAMSARNNANVNADIGVQFTMTFGSVDYDYGGCWDSINNFYRAKVNDIYTVTALIGFPGSSNTGARVVYLYKNGSYHSEIGVSPVENGGGTQVLYHTELELNTNDTVQIRGIQTGSVNMVLNSSNNSLQISRKSFNKVLSLSNQQKYLAKYRSTSAQSIPTATVTILNFNSMEYDTGANVTTGASWKYIAKRQCVIEISLAYILNSGVTWNPPEEFNIQIYKSNSYYERMATNLSKVVHSTYMEVYATGQVPLNAGEFFDLRMYQNSGETVFALADGTLCWMTAKEL